MVFSLIMFFVSFAFILYLIIEAEKTHKDVEYNKKLIKEWSENFKKRVDSRNDVVAKANERVARLEKRMNVISSRLDDAMIAIGDLKIVEPKKRSRK